MGNDDWGDTPATMRVLVADGEPEMLEAVARAFDVDVATSKATCIDLLRANDFDVIVACERLSDGSGLELLSHVGQRWPNVVRILAIEPARRALLRGRLGPFKLFETLSYPIDEAKLEAALTRAAEHIAVREVASPPRAAGTSKPSRSTGPARDARSAGPRPEQTSSSRSPRSSLPSAQPVSTASALAPKGVPGAPGNKAPDYPPLPAKGSKIVPLGSPTATDYRIVPHDYQDQTRHGASVTRRVEPDKTPSLQEKAAALAAGAMAAVVRYIKPQGIAPTRTPPKATPRKKR